MSSDKHSIDNDVENVTHPSEGKKQPSLVRFALISGALLLFAGLIWQAFLPRTGSGSVAPAAGQPLPTRGGALAIGGPPYDFTLQNLEGDTVTLGQFLGQPVVLNFWATWCGPCRIEMPEIQAAYKTYQDDGLVVLAINQNERPIDVETFFLELGLTFQPLLDEGSATGRNYGLANTLPSTVVIDPAGDIVAIHRGILTRDQLDSYLTEALQ